MTVIYRSGSHQQNVDESNHPAIPTFKIPNEVQAFFEKDKIDYTPEKAQADSRLFELLERDPQMSRAELLQDLMTTLIPKIADNLFEPKDFVDQRLDSVLARRETVTQVINAYEDPKELYLALFGRVPSGEVRLAPSAISISFVCEDTADFQFIYNGSYTNHPRNNYNSNIQGVSVADCLVSDVSHSVCAVMPSSDALDTIGSRLTHEHEHIKLWLFEGEQNARLESLLDIIKSSDQEILQGFIADFEPNLVLLRELMYEFVDKLEIVAYIAQGMPIDSAVSIVVDRYQTDDNLQFMLRNSLAQPDLKHKGETWVDETLDMVFANYDEVLKSLGEELIKMQKAGDSLKVVGMRLANTHVRQLV